MTEQPASNKSLRKKLVIVALLVAGGVGVLGWLGWSVEERIKLTEAEEQVSVESLDATQARIKMLEVGNATSSVNRKEPIKPYSPPETGVTAPTPQSPELSSALDKYYLWGLEHRKATLQLQLIKANILFVVVLTILGFGLYLSYIQFKKGDQPEGSLKLGPAGVEITSSILGLFILAFSISFFYLYLVHVFQIEEIGKQNVAPAVAPSNQNR